MTRTFQPVAPVGFGCSALTGSSRSVALATLEAAFDAGVRHFDVARSYGYGEAENILGRWLGGRRSQVTITSKFGIAPPPRTTLVNAVIGVGRRAARLFPGLRPLLQRRARGLVKSGSFTPADAKASLDTSLRALGTDYLDVFLLHDYVPTGESRAELLEYLDGAVAGGKIRQFGTSADPENIRRAIAEEPRLCGVVQFRSSILERASDQLRSVTATRLAITHGALGGAYHAVAAFLEDHPDISRQWVARLDLEVSSPAVLSSLLLNYAASSNRGGMVLFSSRDPQRAAQNARAVVEPVVSEQQVQMFANLVAQQHLTPAG